ncbi:phage holin family protein [Chryseosolibacter indicus]|uniref:Phage holin family protein n=1 Tax=Chryseosolibacter indicus TaxID=2782351 RepID=A0ABS5VZL2_9BACT|nr:phage holin family protein [Chryseosolibacter indicus]MBT1706297.1 phage holin family protein [Chryseosolibacter indicus]
MLRDSLSKFFKVDALINNITGYVETKVELIKVEVKEELAEGLGKVINYLIIAFIFSLVILLISLGAAIVLSEKLGALGGYGIVAGFYLIIGIILLRRSATTSKQIENKILSNFKKKK